MTFVNIFILIFIFETWITTVLSINPGELPTLIPLRYDIQLQLPTSAPDDDLIPAFFGSIKIEFQLSRPVFATYRSPSMAKLPPAVFHFYHQRGGIPDHNGAEIRLQALNLKNFENITLEGNGRQFGVLNTVTEGEEVVITVNEAALAQGRYSLNIGKYTGIITYEKGIFYR